MQRIIPHENDILLGRGGKNNQHIGNEQLRTIARTQIGKYKTSSKKRKSYIVRKIVSYIKSLDPQGRFLKHDYSSNLWREVGDGVAREKASQVLRDAISIHIGSLNLSTRSPKDIRFCSQGIVYKNDTRQRSNNPLPISSLNYQNVNKGSYNFISTTGYKQDFFHNNNIPTTTITVHNQTPEKVGSSSSVLHVLPIHISPDDRIKTDIFNSELQHTPQMKSELKTLCELKDEAKKRKGIDGISWVHLQNINIDRNSQEIIAAVTSNNDIVDFDLFNGALLKHETL